MSFWLLQPIGSRALVFEWFQESNIFLGHILFENQEETDRSDLIMEVTAGVGGQEAMLFTAEMFDMYQQYATYKKWDFEVLEYAASDIGGLRHASAVIGGLNTYKQMKFEGGVHRVQRVPKTEKQGRIHTSTMTVAILPQPDEINLTINPKDLRIETKRASGAGGQHVNKTESAVRIVHIPTGVVSECQQQRSQIKNKERAMQILRAKLYSIKLEEETRKTETARKIQTGSRGRSEKIRTYNFPQDRVTDHRISRSVHDIERFMLGEELLDEMIKSLREYADYETVLEVISESDPTRLR
ncbi:peptide chain release factor 1-like, mitochondrial isoform X2 [Zootoca vivipara]|uniref:peptide chain release factor 1-like, mitochondrial isoform X2 n=1 Tax=Zootoca vivipara TaxID=8524 RepID=UPI00293BA0B0|nr:peptide chain release factor 1-like, mitochondrial isoform X2 [Zootoca vivipara]